MKNRKFALSALSVALLSSYAQMSAAADDLAEFIKPDSSSISIGVGRWSDQRMQQGKFDGMRDKGTYGTIDGSYLKRDDATGTWTSLYLENFGLDTAEFGARYEKQGDWGVNLDYSQIKREHPFTINTGLRGIGSQTQTITNVVPGAGQDVTLDLRREGTTISGFKRLSPELEFRINFKNEEKEGNRQWGVRAYSLLGCGSSKTAGCGALLTPPSFVAEPINSTTRQLDAVLNYQDKKLSVTGGYYGSWYNNKNTRLDVNYGTGRAEMSLPPDNQAHQLYVRANYIFTPTTRGLFKLAYTHATQNDPFIATMNNNVATWAPLASAGGSLDGVVNTTDMLMSITARPMPKLSMRGELSYYDRNDKTQVRIVDRSNGRNNPFRFTNSKAKLEGDYRLSEIYSVKAGVDLFHQRRTISSEIVKTADLWVPYRSSVDEKTYRIDLRRSMSEELSGSIGYSYATRTGSKYDDVNVGVDSATITPIYIADRQRDKLKFALDWAATNDFGMQASLAYTKDNYPVRGERKDGVREGKSQIFSLDANLAMNDNWKAKAWYSLETIRTSLTGPINGVTDWVEDARDQGESLGLGIDGKVSDSLTLGAKFDVTLSRGDFTQTPSSTSPLPAVANRETKLHLFADYALQKNASIRVDLISEKYKTDDWQWRFRTGAPFSYATEGTRVTNNPDQSATFVGVRYNYKFQ